MSESAIALCTSSRISKIFCSSHNFLIACSKIARASLEVLLEPLHINLGVVGGNHEEDLLLLLFVVEEEVLGEHSLRVLPLELYLINHLGDSEDGLVADSLCSC